MTCHWALALVRRRRFETQASVCITVADNQHGSGKATITSRISGAIGRRPLQEQFPNRQLIRTSESCSSTPVRKENLSVFFNASILAKISSTIVVLIKQLYE